MSFRVELEPNAIRSEGSSDLESDLELGHLSLGKTADLEAEDIAQALSYATWRAKEVEAVPDKL